METTLATLDPQLQAVLVPQFEQLGIDQQTMLKEISFAAQILERSQALKKCPANTIVNSILNAVQCGLTLSPISKEAYLVPRDKKCCLDPSYVGLAKTVTNTGAVTSINCQVIYHGDDYIFDLASEKKIERHQPACLVGKERGKPIACYSVATLATGERHVEFLHVDGPGGIYDTARRRSESWKYYEGQIAGGNNWATCAWVSDEEQMIRKSMIKRHTSKLPRSTGDWSKVDSIVAADNVDYSLEAGQQQISRIWTMMQSVENMIVLEGERPNYESEMQQIDDQIANGLTIDEADKVIADLRELLGAHYKTQMALTGYTQDSTYLRGDKAIKIKGYNLFGQIKAVYLDDEGVEQRKAAAVTLQELYEASKEDFTTDNNNTTQS